jgi:hypothetical protein
MGHLSTVVAKRRVYGTLDVKLDIGAGRATRYRAKRGVKRMHATALRAATGRATTSLTATTSTTTATSLLGDYVTKFSKSGIQRADLGLDSSGAIQQSSIGGLHGSHTTGLDHLTILERHVSAAGTSTLSTMRTTVLATTVTTGHFCWGLRNYSTGRTS